MDPLAPGWQSTVLTMCCTVWKDRVVSFCMICWAPWNCSFSKVSMDSACCPAGVEGDVRAPQRHVSAIPSGTRAHARAHVERRQLSSRGVEGSVVVLHKGLRGGVVRRSEARVAGAEAMPDLANFRKPRVHRP